MKLFRKEIKLSASMLSFLFIASAFLIFVPGYPILLGAFFTTLGIFYSFQTMRENNDMQYALLLPVTKAQIVQGKYCFAVFIELCSFLLMTVCTLIRMLFLKNAAVYTANALMCANLSFLGFTLLIFGLYNRIFIGGFFKTAYYFAKPFVTYCVTASIVIVAAESLHHIPGFEAVNAFGFQAIWQQGIVFCIGAAAFPALTVFGVRKSVKRFERVDL